jgi:hypothetical protein
MLWPCCDGCEVKDASKHAAHTLLQMPELQK